MKFYRVRWFDAINGWRQRFATSRRAADDIGTEARQNMSVPLLAGPDVESIEIGNSRQAVLEYLNANHTSGNS